MVSLHKTSIRPRIRSRVVNLRNNDILSPNFRKLVHHVRNLNALCWQHSTATANCLCRIFLEAMVHDTMRRHSTGGGAGQTPAGAAAGRQEDTGDSQVLECSVTASRWTCKQDSKVTSLASRAHVPAFASLCRSLGFIHITASALTLPA